MSPFDNRHLNRRDNQHWIFSIPKTTFQHSAECWNVLGEGLARDRPDEFMLLVRTLVQEGLLEVVSGQPKLRVVLNKVMQGRGNYEAKGDKGVGPRILEYSEAKGSAIYSVSRSLPAGPLPAPINSWGAGLPDIFNKIFRQLVVMPP